MNDLILVWIFGFVLIFILIASRQRRIWRLIGSGLIFLNGILGVYIVDNIFGQLVMYITLLYFFMNLVDAIPT